MTQVMINVRLTDKEVLSVLDEQGKRGLSLQEIADLVDCSRNTAFRAVNRLESAGRIRRSYGGGANKTKYEVIELN